jgi:hypothetical protein
MFSGSLQQMPCKARYVQLQSSKDALQGILCSIAVFSRWARGRRMPGTIRQCSRMMLKECQGYCLTLASWLIVTAASHLLCQELLHASLMPTE